MIVNVVPVGSVDSFDYFLYPEQNPIHQNYFYNQVNNISQALNDFGRKFMQTSREIYDKINDSEAIRLAKSALRYARGAVHPNTIVTLNDIESIRAAQPVMQRYIMAEPIVREFYHKQLIDGYSDTYTDLHPNKIGINHYDYRRVMDGIVQDSEDDNGEYEWVSMQFMEDLNPGDRELEFHEKRNVMLTWDAVRAYMKSGMEDPTNPFGGKIG